MELHAPAVWLFSVSLTILAVALICALTDIWFLGVQGSWIAILAYGVLAIGILGKTKLSGGKADGISST